MTANLVELKGGLIVRGDVIAGLVALENRGFTFRLDEGRIYVEPREAVTAEDGQWLTANRNHVLACLAYQVPPELVP